MINGEVLLPIYVPEMYEKNLTFKLFTLSTSSEKWDLIIQ